ncbi:unnamed protein product [Effrenium voratum]|uniref:Uncharacterized protein n=1 Tax=Effrenium voratum TaxID=2562239 RepID=A0AA36IL14_9DINO|nr:unnamed protein product [Effrenium voratum]
MHVRHFGSSVQRPAPRFFLLANYDNLCVIMRSFPFALVLVCGATRLEEIENDTSGEAGPMTCCLMDPVLELESLSVSAIDPQHGDVTQCRVTTALVCGSHEECEEKCKNDIKANLLTLKLLTPLRREEQGEAGQALTAAKAALRQAQQALDLAQDKALAFEENRVAAHRLLCHHECADANATVGIGHDERQNCTLNCRRKLMLKISRCDNLAREAIRPRAIGLDVAATCPRRFAFTPALAGDAPDYLEVLQDKFGEKPMHKVMKVADQMKVLGSRSHAVMIYFYFEHASCKKMKQAIELLYRQRQHDSRFMDRASQPTDDGPLLKGPIQPTSTKAKKDEADAKYSNCTSRVKEAARRESKAEKRSVSPVGICGGGDCCCSFVEGSVATPLLVSASTFGSWGKCKLIRPYARSGFSFCRTYNTECPNCRKLVCANNGAGSCNWDGRCTQKSVLLGSPDDGKIWQQAMFIPLARIVEMVHLRIRDVVSAEVGQDYALDFCCAVRFSGFVQAIARLAMHFRTLQVHRGTMHESVLSRLKALDKFVLEVEAKYRSNRVSLRLLAEEARRLLDRTARETELRSAARACLQEVKGRKKVVESHIAAVDAKYGAELERALNAACSSLRQLKQLDRCHFQNLAQYRHMPAALVRVLGAAKAMLLHIEEPSDGAPVLTRAVPKHALAAATAAAAGPIGIPQERPRMFDWAKTLAAAETLDTLSAAAAGQALPGWLAEVLEKFLACPDCEASQLWAMSPAAARISQWLRARLACHRVLMRMEDERQSMGDLSSQLVEVNASLATAKAELRRAERALEDLEAAHLATVQQRQTLGRSETSLQLQLERAQQVLEIAAPRRRECQVLVPEILESEESPAQWGAILTIAVLSCYGAAFGPALRLPVMKELQQVLQDCGVPTPPNLFTSAYLQHFLPRSFLEAYRWPDCNLFQSALATEVRFGREEKSGLAFDLRSSLCTLMLDPFGIATDWLKALGAAPGGKLCQLKMEPLGQGLPK